MTGSRISSDGLDSRRRRILYRAWHRGIREMDLIIGQFCDLELAGLTEHELDELEAIMDEQDQDLISWIRGDAIVPAGRLTPLFSRIAATRPDFTTPNAAGDLA